MAHEEIRRAGLPVSARDVFGAEFHGGLKFRPPPRVCGEIS
jgi:hypothetical protein